MSFRKIMNTLTSATVGGGLGAAYSSVRNYFTQPDTSQINQLDAYTMTMNFLNNIVGQFPNCQITGFPEAKNYSISCSDTNNTEWNQFNALNAVANRYNNLTTQNQQDYAKLANSFLGYAFTTFVENIGIDTLLGVILGVAAYRTYQNYRSLDDYIKREDVGIQAPEVEQKRPVPRR